MKVWFYLIQFTWGLPQNLLGLILFLRYRRQHPEWPRYSYHGAQFIEWKRSSSLSLGCFIFFGHGNSGSSAAMRVHEYGHTIQSMVLGPLYLPIIGLPSLCWANVPACVHRWAGKDRVYFRFYTEKWANHWGERVTGEPSPGEEKR